MRFSLTIGFVLAALAVASPLPAAAPAALGDGLTVPPLIPPVPGVTDPLTTIIPPVPIVRGPIPPIAESPPFVSSDIRPKKVGYFWAGSGDRAHKDFLAAYSLDDDTFGTFLHLADAPTSGNEPHHLNVAADGKTLLGTGLLSLLKLQDTAYFFDISDPYRPAFKKSQRTLLSSIADEIVAKPGGGWFVTYMGSAAGTSPGRLAEFDANHNLIGEWPSILDVPGAANTLGQFSPHGLSIDFPRDVILTSDFVVPLSTLKPTLGVQSANTLRLWRLSTRTILNTITIPHGGGIQDVKFIPGNAEGAAIATAVHLGQVWIVYPHRIDPATNRPGTAELLYDLGPAARDTVAIYTDLSADGKSLYLSLTTANHVAALDISDLANVVRLDNPGDVHPVIGPHCVRVTPDQTHAVVLGYFVQQGDVGVLNTPADYKVHYVQRDEATGGLRWETERTIDFAREFAARGGAKPHFAVVGDFTDPERPRWNSY
ncbi:hypothetical protein DFH27DRAFT_594647 [Peziza echinospora]|nr:hypothetical protein DFH27DRAFT_594647 [Peziza echinospora]